MERIHIAGVIAIVLVGIAVGFGVYSPGETDDTGEENLTTLKLGHVPHLLNSPHYTAVEKGFYREAGFDPEFVKLPGPEMGQALVNGDIDVAQVATVPAVYMAQSDLPIVNIARTARFTENKSGAMIILSKDINVSEPSDFEGMTLGSCCSGSMGELFLHMWADRNNLSFDEDFTYTTVGDEQGFLSAFASGSVDAVYRGVGYPTFTMLKQEGLVQEEPFHELENSQYIASYAAVREEWLEEETEKVRRFLDAYVKAAEYARNNPEEREEFVAKHSGYDVETLRKAKNPVISEDLSIDVGTLNTVADLMLQYELVEEDQDMQQLVDNQYVEDAMDRAGDG